MTHRSVWAVFKGSSEFARREIWTLGLRLKDQRVKADYQTSFRGPLTKAANEAIARAAVLLALLDRL